MSPTLLSAAVAFALGFGGAWHLQNLRMDSDEKDRLTVAIESERLVSRLESQRSAQNIAAQNDRALRESRLRADAAASSAVVAGMRSALAATVQASRDNPTTCADTASAISVALTDISESYSELAATCDRHVSDIQTLIAAWPR